VVVVAMGVAVVGDVVMVGHRGSTSGPHSGRPGPPARS
jgi:hypothetical protein